MEKITENEELYFKKAVQSYLNNEEEIKVLLKGIKERKKKNKELSSIILTILKEKDISQLDLGGNYEGKKMIYSQNNSMSSIKFTDVEDVIRAFIDNKDRADSLIKKIQETRTERKNERLKIESKKNKKAKKLSNIANSNSEKEAVPEGLEYLQNY